MPRRPNTKPTHIYWLIDIRPEIIAAGWSNGQPFYCGKTVKSVAHRLSQHKHTARTRPHGNVGKRLLRCGEFVRIQTMEIVDPSNSWVAREQHWIELIRFSFPGCTNVSKGGSGPAGYIHTESAIAKMRGRVISEEHRRAISKAKTGTTHTEVTRRALRELMLKRVFSDEKQTEINEKIRRKATGRKHSEITRSRIGAVQIGKTLTLNHRVKISNALKGRPGRTLSREERERISDRQRGRKRSSEACAKTSASLKGRKRPPEVCERLRQANLGKTLSKEHRAKLAAAQSGKKLSDETRAKMRLSQLARHAARRAEAQQNA